MSREKAQLSAAQAAEDHLQELKVESLSQARRHSHVPDMAERIPKLSTRSTDYAFVNRAYVGSSNSLAGPTVEAPVTSVMREQYWACSRWPFSQRFLAIAVGILIGAVIGLAVTVGMKGKDDGNLIGGVFTNLGRQS